MPRTASTDARWSSRTWAMWAAISSVDRAVCPARPFTSEATTAKPLPASPARAASIVAFSASRLVLPGDLADHVGHRADPPTS